MRKRAIETKQTVGKWYAFLGLPLKSKLKYVIYLFKIEKELQNIGFSDGFKNGWAIHLGVKRI